MKIRVVALDLKTKILSGRGNDWCWFQRYDRSILLVRILESGGQEGVSLNEVVRRKLLPIFLQDRGWRPENVLYITDEPGLTTTAVEQGFFVFEIVGQCTVEGIIGKINLIEYQSDVAPRLLR